MRHLSITRLIRSPSDSVWKVSSLLASTHLFSYTAMWGFAIYQIQIPNAFVSVKIGVNVTSAVLRLKILVMYILLPRALSRYKGKKPQGRSQKLPVLVKCYFNWWRLRFKEVTVSCDMLISIWTRKWLVLEYTLALLIVFSLCIVSLL